MGLHETRDHSGKIFKIFFSFCWVGEYVFSVSYRVAFHLLVEVSSQPIVGMIIVMHSLLGLCYIGVFWLLILVSDTVKSMSEKMWELEHMVRKMLFDSYGAGEHYESHVESSSSLFRVMKYRTPEQGEESAMGLVAHTDKNMITVLCPNQVEGLQVQSKEEGDWIHLTPRADSFIVIIGDTLKVRNSLAHTPSLTYLSRPTESNIENY